MYKQILTYIVNTIIGAGISLGVIYLLMVLGGFRERLKELLLDIEKLKVDSRRAKENTHRILNDIEKIKQAIGKTSANDYWKDGNKKEHKETLATKTPSAYTNELGQSFTDEDLHKATEYAADLIYNGSTRPDALTQATEKYSVPRSAINSLLSTLRKVD